MKSTNMGKTFSLWTAAVMAKICPALDLYVAELQSVRLQIYSWDKYFVYSNTSCVPRVIVLKWWELLLFVENQVFLARLTKKSRLFWLALLGFLLLILFYNQIMC